MRVIQVKDIFSDLERLSAGLMILRDTVHHRIKRYGEILKYIEQDRDLLHNSSPLQLTEEEKETIITYLDYNNFYYEDKLNKYVLLRLNTSISEGNPNYDSYKKITIEHVLPQNPKSNSQWMKWFPTEQEREKYVHCLGNLVLLSRRKNSSAKNYDFNEKKEKYFNTPITNFSLTIQVINQQEWTPEVITNRQLELINKLKEIWKLI